MLEDRLSRLEGRDQSHSPNSMISPAPTTGNNDNCLDAQIPEHVERTSDLSSRVGMLELRTINMEPQYLGSSSAFAFSRIVNFSLVRDLPIESALTGLNDKRSSSPMPCLLPECDLALTLSNAYFKHIHPQYPFLHEPTFRSWETTFYHSSENFLDSEFCSQPLFFLNMVSTQMLSAVNQFHIFEV